MDAAKAPISAAEQLAAWGQHVGLPTVEPDVDRADPASVAFEAVQMQYRSVRA
jgi:signal recognition particle GTPase